MGNKTVLLSVFLLSCLITLGQPGFKIHNGANFTVHDNAELGIYINTTVAGNFGTRNCLVRFYGQSWTNESTALFQDESSSGTGFSGIGGQFYFIQPNPLTGLSSAQSINGGLSDIFLLNGLSFPNFVIDNPGHVTLTTSNLRVRGDFSFIAGSLLTGSHAIGIGGDISGYGVNNFFSTDVNGSLVRYNVGNADMVFPVGFDTYNPVTIKEAGTTDHFAVAALQHLLLQGATGNMATINAVDASWHITDAVPGGNNLTISPGWFATDELPGFNRNTSAVSRYAAGWDVIRSAAANGTTLFSQSRANIAATGYFSVQEPGAALPLTLESFTGKLQNNNALLEWRTANEMQVSRFEVLHSSNGVDFFAIGSVPARNGQSNTYHYTDPNLPDGLHYYRLAMIDLDRTKKYSGTITLYISSMNKVLVYPTITRSVINVQLPQNIFYQKARATLLGTSGQTLSVFILQKGSNQLLLGNLAAGAYSLRIDTDNETIVKQIIIVQ